MVEEIHVNWENMQEYMEKQKKSLEQTFGEKIKFVGIQLHFLTEKSNVLVSNGMYAEGFNKEDYEE